MARQRFKLSRICSSDRYALSKKIHREYIERIHVENASEVQRISSTTKVKEKCFVKCFGKVIEVSGIEAAAITGSMAIIRK